MKFAFKSAVKFRADILTLKFLYLFIRLGSIVNLSKILNPYGNYNCYIACVFPATASHSLGNKIHCSPRDQSLSGNCGATTTRPFYVRKTTSLKHNLLKFSTGTK